MLTPMRLRAKVTKSCDKFYCGPCESSTAKILPALPREALIKLQGLKYTNKLNQS